MESYKELMEEAGIRKPEILVSDFEDGWKKAAADVLPSAQQQICIFHVNKNVILHVFRKWKKAPEDPDESDDGNDHQTHVPDDQVNIAAREHINRFKRRIKGTIIDSPGSLPSKIPHTKEGLILCWEHVAYSSTEADFNAAWHRLIDEFGEDQKAIVDYLEETYLPYRYEWANCFISQYRNYGTRTTSPVESSHKNLKSYLQNNRGDLLKIAESLERMVAKMKDDYRDTLNLQSTRVRTTYLGREWLGTLTMVCSYKAIDLLAIEHRKAEACIPSPSRPFPRTLQPCPPEGCHFEQQYGLPCAFKILKNMEVSEEKPRVTPLQPTDVDVHWLTGKNLADNEPLLLIKEPYTQKPRGRPRTGAVTLPQVLQSYHRRRELHPSVRRHPSQWELINLDSDDEAPSQRPSGSRGGLQQSQQRGGSQLQRGRGTRGGRGGTRGSIRGSIRGGARGGSVMASSTASSVTSTQEAIDTLRRQQQDLVVQQAARAAKRRRVAPSAEDLAAAELEDWQDIDDILEEVIDLTED